MGVKELLILLASHGPEVANWFLYAQGHAVGVDASVWLHAFVAVFYKAVLERDYKGVVKGMIDRVYKMKERGVYCILVFDGASNTLAKSHTTTERKVRHDATVLKKQKLLDEA